MSRNTTAVNDATTRGSIRPCSPAPDTSRTACAREQTGSSHAALLLKQIPETVSINPTPQSLTQCNPRTTSAATMKPSRMPIAEAPHGSRAVQVTSPPPKSAARSCEAWQRTMRHDAAPAFTCHVHHVRRGRRGPPSFPTGRLLRERQALPQNHSCQHARQPPCRATTHARRQ